MSIDLKLQRKDGQKGEQEKPIQEDTQTDEKASPDAGRDGSNPQQGDKPCTVPWECNRMAEKRFWKKG